VSRAERLKCRESRVGPDVASRGPTSGCSDVRDLGGEALGDPATSRLYRYSGRPVVTDGPYSESKEHLAGFFLIDVDTPERADAVARTFAGPGETIELRPIHVF